MGSGWVDRGLVPLLGLVGLGLLIREAQALLGLSLRTLLLRPARPGSWSAGSLYYTSKYYSGTTNPGYTSTTHGYTDRLDHATLAARTDWD